MNEQFHRIYGYYNKIELRIYSADDNKTKYSSTEVDIYTNYPMSISRRQRFYGDRHEESEGRHIVEVSVLRQRTKRGEPLIMSVKNELQYLMGWGGRSHNRAPEKFKCLFVLPKCNDFSVLIEKKKPYYHLMNIRMTKNNLLTCLSRALYRSCFEEDNLILLEYLYKMINLPENITYALENRTPYWFFDVESKEKLEVRLKTSLIDTDTAALEISDGIWAPISIKDLDIFINYFYHGHTRSKKWAYLSPKKLWSILMGYAPSTSQQKLMREFLAQNRTQDIVENRAKELMDSLERKYPNRIKIIQVKTYVYIDNQYVSVESQHRQSRHNNPFFNGQIRGPICIDNIHQNSSVGDQYAARALALLNDRITVNLVNTRKYVRRQTRRIKIGLE